MPASLSLGRGGGVPAGEKYVPGYTPGRERIGQEVGAGLKTLREQMAYRGLSGGGGEQRGIRDIVMAGQGELGHLNDALAGREQEQAFQASESQKNRDLSAAQAGLQAAMGVEDKDYTDPFGRTWRGGQREAAIEQAINAIRGLTGYSIPGSGVGMSRGGY